MALRLSESLVEKGTYDRQDVITRYLNWYLGPPKDTGYSFCCVALCCGVVVLRCVVLYVKLRNIIFNYDLALDKAFDTGQTFFSVFKLYSHGTPIEQAAETMKSSAGINAAHRSYVKSFSMLF